MAGHFVVLSCLRQISNLHSVQVIRTCPMDRKRLSGKTAELRLREHHDAPPDLADRPVVYLFVAVPGIRPEPVLIGYGVLEATPQGSA
jgi:hypothetical protein